MPQSDHHINKIVISMASFVSLKLLFCVGWSMAAAWIQAPVNVFGGSIRTWSSSSSSGLFMTSKDNQQPPSEQTSVRMPVAGVSVSPTGFHVMLNTTKGVLPIPITRDPQDAYAATSPESLTIIQLLSGVDMAGAILPPETLAKMTVLSCELLPEFLSSPTQCAVVEYIQKVLPEGQTSFSEAHPWIQARFKLPQVTLDQLGLTYEKESGSWRCRLACALKEFGQLNVVATPEIVRPVCYNYDAETSPLFTCIALALRYKAPIVVENFGDVQVPKDLDKDFPQRTTVANIQKQSSRVTQNIERGFEIHKLTGALQIAMKLGDQGAVKKIRAKLDEYDSLNELPTTTSGKEDQDQNSIEDDDLLDDADKNILQ